MPSTTTTTTTTTTTNTRSVSLYHRKSLLFSHNNGLKKKTRPSTWTTTCHRRYTISPRVSRWVSQHKQQFRSSRLTIATISSLTTSTNDSDTIVALPNEHHHPCHYYPERSIFHTQSLLFLFGFLYFPCWWIGGYYLKVEGTTTAADLESQQQQQPVHPSLLANGKTTSRHLPLYHWWQPSAMQQHDDCLLFYHWNRCMSLVSIVLLIFETGLIIWYYVAY